jgi:hypothetical protein
MDLISNASVKNANGAMTASDLVLRLHQTAAP